MKRIGHKIDMEQSNSEKSGSDIIIICDLACINHPYDIKFRTAFFAQFCSEKMCDHDRLFLFFRFFLVNRSKLGLVLRQHGR